MYPNDPNQPQSPPPEPPAAAPPSDFSIDYLNQIATPAQRSGGPSRLVMIAALVGGVLAVGLFGLLMIGGASSSNDKLVDVYLRLETMQSLADEQQKPLRENSLRSTNSTLKIILSNAMSDIEQPMANNGITVKKISKKRVAEEAAYRQKLSDTFEDARLNATLDRTYAREMNYQITNLRAMMRAAASSSTSESFAKFVTTTEENLAPLNKQFTTFAGAK